LWNAFDQHVIYPHIPLLALPKVASVLDI